MMRLAPCASCTDQTGDARERLRQLQLLALLEHPDALPAKLALRLARELLTLTGCQSAFRCEPVEEIRP
jgi:hypothetical protein